MRPAGGGACSCRFGPVRHLLEEVHQLRQAAAVLTLDAVPVLPCRAAVPAEVGLAAPPRCRRCGRLGDPREDSGRRIRVKPLLVKATQPRGSALCADTTPSQSRNVQRLWQKHPDRPFVAGENLANQLVDPPGWAFSDFIADLAASHCVGRSCQMIGSARQDPRRRSIRTTRRPCPRASSPSRADRWARWPGALEQYFTQRGLALPTDQTQHLAAGRRQRRVDAVPGPLRPAVGGLQHLDAASTRTSAAGRQGPRADGTIESAIAGCSW